MAHDDQTGPVWTMHERIERFTPHGEMVHTEHGLTCSLWCQRAFRIAYATATTPSSGSSDSARRACCTSSLEKCDA